jgi:cystathionine beta-lyase
VVLVVINVEKKLKFATRLLHDGKERNQVMGASAVPIFQTSTFHQEDIFDPPKFNYSRLGNPTREALEKMVAQLEGGTHGFAYASGMSAISATFFLFSAGDHVIVSHDVYAPVHKLLTTAFARFGLEVSFVDTTDLDQIRAAIRPNTKGLYLETPSNPLLRVTDIAGAAEIARQHGMLTILDNTFMSPYLQRPLELGVNIVVHSATKYIGGHSDVVAGVAVTNLEEIAQALYMVQIGGGAVLGPQDCYLLHRGLKTLKVRMDAACAGAEKLAQFLYEQEQRGVVGKVYYPGLEHHPGHEIQKRQAGGFGGVVTFDVGSAERARELMQRLTLPLIGISLGAVESIVSYPPTMSHRFTPPEVQEAMGITPGLVRYSVGLEDPDDLIEDLKQALGV